MNLVSTFFQNATLVDWFPCSVESGHLRVERGRIAAVGRDVVAAPSDEVVDCEGRLLAPGLVNGHTHLYSALAAGMPTPADPPSCFHQILQRVWWRLDRAHTHDSVEWSGVSGALEALRAGTTTLIDHHASPGCIEGSLDALERGVATVGCRGILCYEVTDRNGAGEATAGLAENGRYLQRHPPGQPGKFAGLVGAHASFTLEEESLAGCVDLAQRSGVGLHIHVAEDAVDELLTRQRFGQGLWDRFERQGVLDVPNSLWAHGTHLSPADVARFNDRPQLALAHNPRSNMNNGVGYTPAASLARPPLLGTDGIGSDLWTEAQVAEFKSHDAGAPVPFGGSLAMLAASARFAGERLGVPLGQLVSGGAADLLLLDDDPVTPLKTESLAAHFLFRWGPRHVRDVMIGGEWCLRDRQFVRGDEASLLSASRAAAAALHRRMAELE